MRNEFITISALVVLTFAVGHLLDITWMKYLWVLFPVVILGVYDMLQKKRTILRNFPILGHFRYLFELVRPEINQYFIESNTNGRPLNREQRSVIYQRAKRELDTLPFGTQRDVYEIGHEWVNHSLSPKHVDMDNMRIDIGGKDTKHPYRASILNISAMSYGSLSSHAIMAMNWGAKLGDFAHNTGEGGLSPHHLKYGGDLIWQIGTGYFGARTKDGKFDETLYAENSARTEVKMIELKLSQGAKPGHGGILPGAKVTKEIANIRNVPIGEDVISPPAHSSFDTPIGLLEFVCKLRELSGGKPVGFKLCIGRRREFYSICKAMIQTKMYPDFITVDGGEGGTGAAPLEFSNSIGSPLFEGLIFVDNALRGSGLRDKIKVISSGKVVTGFDIVKHLALGTDLVFSARAMMIAVGCIQALRCNSNHCPTGVATTDPELVRGLNIKNKKDRVMCYHQETVESAAEIIGAIGLTHPEDVRPFHLMRRVRPSIVKDYSELYPKLNHEQLLHEDQAPYKDRMLWDLASADRFA